MPVEKRRKALILENRSRQWGDTFQSRPHTGGRQSSNDCFYPSPPPSTTPEERPCAAECSRETHHRSSSLQKFNFLSTDATTRSDPRHPNAMISTGGWSLPTLLNHSSNFVPAKRILATSHRLAETIEEFENKGEPLVIEGYNEHPEWPHEMFTLNSFVKHAASNEISVRNVYDWSDETMSLENFVEKCRSASHHAAADERVRLYGKDIECPEPWEHWLKNGNLIPSSLIGNGPRDLFRHRPESASVQTLMCYLGIGDTFTPCHKDLCASSGQNLMCYTEDGGTSFWFMTKGSSSVEAARYFHELGRELDHENYVIQLDELARAPFKIYIIEQKVGDLVLVPPRSCHQVVNFGGITVKMSWSRMTFQGLSMAFHHELPIYRRVCRPEVYRVKSTIHYALVGQTNHLQLLVHQKNNSSALSSMLVVPRTSDLSDFKALLSLYDCVLAEEYALDNKNMHHVVLKADDVDDEDHLICDFCGGDIFQSFFDCGDCTEDGNHLHICPGCFVEGRHCRCRCMQPVQYRYFDKLVEVRDRAEEAIRRYEEGHGQTFRQELALQNASVPSLFQAACYLNKIRKNTKWSCIWSEAHACWHDSALQCKQCHGSRCFSYITSRWHVHSSEALMAHSSDASHSTYHKIHLEGKKKYSADQRNLEQSQKLGDYHQGYSLLLYNALNFTHCNPINSRFLTRGWYDKKKEVALDKQVQDNCTSERQASTGISSRGPRIVRDMTMPEPGTKHTDSDSYQMTLDCATTIKKRPLFYVDVPRAPYSIRRALSGCVGQSSAKDSTDGRPPLKIRRRSNKQDEKEFLQNRAVDRLATYRSSESDSISKIGPRLDSISLQGTPENHTPTFSANDKASKKKIPSSLHFKKKEAVPLDDVFVSPVKDGLAAHGPLQSDLSSFSGPSIFPTPNLIQQTSNRKVPLDFLSSAISGACQSPSAGSFDSQTQEPAINEVTNKIAETMDLMGMTFHSVAKLMRQPQLGAFARDNAVPLSALSGAPPLLPQSFDNRIKNHADHAAPHSSFQFEGGSLHSGIDNFEPHPEFKGTYAQASWTEGPSEHTNRRLQSQHVCSRFPYEVGHSSRSSYRRRQPFNEQQKYRKPRHPHHDRSPGFGRPLKQNYADQSRYSNDNLFPHKLGSDYLRQRTSPPHRSSPQKPCFDPIHQYSWDESPRAPHSPTRHENWQGEHMLYNDPSPAQYADDSQLYDAVYNAQYLYYRDRREEDNMTVMDLTPSMSHADVLERSTWLSQNTNPFYREDYRKDSPSMSYFRGDPRTFIVDHSDTKASSSGPRMAAAQKNAKESRAELEEHRSVSRRRVSEASLLLPEEQEWEDDYDQSCKDDSFLSQDTRPTILTHTKEGSISLGLQEDELTKNHWI